MGNISALRRLADGLLAKNNYEDAFLIYDEIYTQIWASVGFVFQGLTRFSYDFLTYKIKSSIDFKNMFIEPAMNSVFTKWFALDMDETLNEFIFCLDGRLKSVTGSNVLLAKNDPHVIINDFLVLYNLIIYAGSDKWMKAILRIITPLLEDNRLKKIRPNYHESEIKKQIIEASRKIKETDWNNINYVILEYLKKTGEEHSDFYTALDKIINPDRYEKHEKSYSHGRQKAFIFDAATEDEKVIYYSRIIGIEGTVTKYILRKKYLEIISKYHPDKFQNYGEETLKMAERKTKEINIAYEWLSEKLF
jgi:hypothetical protein